MKKSEIYICLAIFFVMVAVYVFHLPPNVLWGDNARLAILSKFPKFSTMTDYPLHTLTGRIFGWLPVGNYYFRQGLRVSFFAGLTVMVFYLIIKELTGSRKLSLFTCSAFAFSHTFWLLAEMNEAYILALFFIALQILFLFKWHARGRNIFLYSAAFLFGASLLAHRVSMLCGFGYIYFFIAKKDKPVIKLRRFMIAGILCLIGASPAIYMLLTKSGGSGSFNIVNVIRKIFCDVSLIDTSGIKRRVVYYPAYLFYQFPGFGILAGIAGLVFSLRRKRNTAVFLLIIMLSYFCVYLVYMRQRVFFIALPGYFAFAVFIGVGLNYLANTKFFLKYKQLWNVGLVSLIIVPFFGYRAAPWMVKKMNINLGTVRNLKYRDNAKYYLLPDKRNTYGPYLYAKNAFKEAGQNAVIIGDFNPGMVLKYFHEVENMRKDINIDWGIDSIVHDSANPEEDIVRYVQKYMGGYPIYLADTYEPYYHTSYLKKHFLITPLKSLSKIEQGQS